MSSETMDELPDPDMLSVADAVCAALDTGTTNMTAAKLMAKEILRLERENEKLQAIVDKLPKTADGVPMVPELRVFWLSDNPESLSKGGVVHSIEVWEPREGMLRGLHRTVIARKFEPINGDEDCSLDSVGLFSTRKAAENARKEAENGHNT